MAILLNSDPTKKFFELMTRDDKNVTKAIGKYIQEGSIV